MAQQTIFRQLSELALSLEGMYVRASHERMNGLVSRGSLTALHHAGRSVRNHVNAYHAMPDETFEYGVVPVPDDIKQVHRNDVQETWSLYETYTQATGRDFADDYAMPDFYGVPTGHKTVYGLSDLCEGARLASAKANDLHAQGVLSTTARDYVSEASRMLDDDLAAMQQDSSS